MTDTAGTIECAAMEARLLGGERPQEDPALAAHLGSCLRCFRAASEMRDLPRLAHLLQSTAPAVDPGPAFWDSFPARVADAWESEQAAAAGTPVRRAWQRWLSWLRRPVPAALVGAACAAALVFWLGRFSHPHPGEGAAPTAAASETAVALVGETPLDHEDDLGEDFVHSLDASGLELLLEAPPRAASPARGVSALDEGDDDDAPAAEELDLLDEGELRAVSEKLGRSI